MEHFADRANARTIPITVLDRPAYRAWIKRQAKRVQTWLKVNEFKPEAGRVAIVPARDGSVERVVLAVGRDPSMWSFAGLRGRLPRGRYAVDGRLEPGVAYRAALGWALATYKFERYKSSGKHWPTLVWPDGCDRAAVERTASAMTLGRDLINTPAGDMGPPHLAEAATEVAERHGAKINVIVGKALLDKGYPAIHAVGRASSREPRLIDVRWGSTRAKKVTLVGKGVCFDSGGLDLKTAAGMKLMKKDMGGGAAMLALADMVMGARLNVRLRLLIPAVENSVSGDAYRPLDVVPTRKGITVEIGNTDAEGRVILCDALAEADGDDPDLIVDFATLTGAARVALGTELPALFSSDDRIAEALLAAGTAAEDPLWRLPLHRPYRRYLDSEVADINNMSRVGQGGAITAALYLQEFVRSKTRWVHVDTMGWNTSARPGRPTGGEVFGIRAVFDLLAERYGHRK